MDIKSSQTHTTTNIGKAELQILNKIAALHGMKNIQFLNAAVQYLRKTGINPSEPELSPKEEMTKLEKRVNEVIKFFRVFEQDKLLPLLERLILIEKKIESTLTDLPQNSDLLKEFSEIKRMFKDALEESKHAKQIYNSNNEILDNRLKDLRNLSLQNTQMIISLFEALKNKGITGKFTDENIKKFYESCQ
jgi:hypothetical protein